MISSNTVELQSHGCGEIVGRTKAVEYTYPVGEALDDLSEAGRHDRAELLSLPLDPIRVGAHASGRGLRIEQDHERPVRHEVSDGDVQLEHTIDAEAPRDTLVDDGGVEIAVAHDVGAARERGPDHLVGELSTRCGKERRLRPRRHRFATEEQLADPLAERRATRLPRRHDLVTGLDEVRAQKLRLRRLPRPVHSLEGDEHASTIRRVRAIVTGGAGFIGSHVVDALLNRGDEVVVVDNLTSGRRENISAGARLAEVDIRDDALDRVFDEVSPELCFHLAAQADVRASVERPAEDASVNVLGTVRVLEAARRSGAQVVFSSTGGAIYGECVRAAAEGDLTLPVSPYGAAKLAGEEYLAAFNRLYGSGHVSLRLGNVYGPRQDPHGEAGVVAIFLGRLAAGTRCRVFGDGSQTRDYVYVGDVVRASLGAAGRAGGVFNVGSGLETSVLDLFERCRSVAGGGLDAELAPARLGELQRSFLDASLAGRELDWRAETSLDDGLRTTWDSIAPT